MIGKQVAHDRITAKLGAGSMQVARRLQAMIEHLLHVLPEARRAALQQELSLLQ